MMLVFSFHPLVTAYEGVYNDDALTAEEAPITVAGAFSVECYCVTYLREVLGVNINGHAYTIEGNIFSPEVGDVILFSYETDDHAALITAKLKTGYWVKEANFHTCQAGERFVSFDDPFIRGFYRDLNALASSS